MEFNRRVRAGTEGREGGIRSEYLSGAGKMFWHARFVIGHVNTGVVKVSSFLDILSLLRNKDITKFCGLALLHLTLIYIVEPIFNWFTSFQSRDLLYIFLCQSFDTLGLVLWLTDLVLGRNMEIEIGIQMLITGNGPIVFRVITSLVDKVEHSLEPGRDLHGVSRWRIWTPLVAVGQEQIRQGGGGGSLRK